MTRILGLAGAACLLLASIATPVAARGLHANHAAKQFTVGVVLDVGVISGLLEKNKVGAAKHNTIGYMGGLSIPPVNRYIAGYIQGAKKVDPSIKVLSGYSQSFTDQGKGKQIGLQQISQGADILFQ